METFVMFKKCTYSGCWNLLLLNQKSNKTAVAYMYISWDMVDKIVMLSNTQI